MRKLPESVKHPSHILDRPSGTLHHIYVQSLALLRLQDIVRKLIPGSVFVASCKDGTLHLMTPSSALATKLRYSQRNLVASLRGRNTSWDIDRIKVSVRPDLNPVERPAPRTALPPSPDNARQLVSTAKYIEDEPLRKALIGLSRRAKSN